MLFIFYRCRKIWFTIQNVPIKFGLPGLVAFAFSPFTIQNVPIKLKYAESSLSRYEKFTIQNVPIKYFILVSSCKSFIIYNTKCSY